MPIGFNPTGDSSNKGAKPSKKNPVTQAPEEEKTSGPVDNDMDDDSDFDIQPKKQNKKLVYIGIALVAALIIGIVYYATTSDNTPTIENTTESVTSDVQDDLSSDEDDEEGFIYDENGNPVYSKEDNSVVKEGAIDPGIADYSASTQNTTTDRISDTDETLKDINGVDIKSTYNVLSRDYLYDYVSYTAKRGIIDDGMEIYWLEADYHGKKYRLQVPFYYFKDFDEKGVCKVQVEVLNIEGGGKVISYMQVVSDDAGTGGSENE